MTSQTSKARREKERKHTHGAAWRRDASVLPAPVDPMVRVSAISALPPSSTIPSSPHAGHVSRSKRAHVGSCLARPRATQAPPYEKGQLPEGRSMQWPGSLLVPRPLACNAEVTDVDNAARATMRARAECGFAAADAYPCLPRHSTTKPPARWLSHASAAHVLTPSHQQACGALNSAGHQQSRSNPECRGRHEPSSSFSLCCQCSPAQPCILDRVSVSRKRHACAQPVECQGRGRARVCYW